MIAAKPLRLDTHASNPHPSSAAPLQVTVPYLRSEYGKEFDFEAPVKLLDRLMHSMPSSRQQQVIVLGQVLAADVNIGYEDIVNTQAGPRFVVSVFFLSSLSCLACGYTAACSLSCSGSTAACSWPAACWTRVAGGWVPETCTGQVRAIRLVGGCD